MSPRNGRGNRFEISAPLQGTMVSGPALGIGIQLISLRIQFLGTPTQPPNIYYTYTLTSFQSSSSVAVTQRSGGLREQNPLFRLKMIKSGLVRSVINLHPNQLVIYSRLKRTNMFPRYPPMLIFSSSMASIGESAQKKSLKSAGGVMVILDNSDWYPKTVQFLQEKLDWFQVDFHGFGPINNYTWTTSIFINPVRRQELKYRSSLSSISGLVQVADDDY